MRFLDVCDELITEIEEHSKNVANACLRMFHHLTPLQQKELLPFKSDKYTPEEIVVLCGLYHDIGKTYIKRFYPNMLDKKKFDDVDRLRIRQHTLMGAELIQTISEQDIVDEVLSAYLIQSCLFHHEKLNGKGYFRISNPPLIAQMVMVADIYSAGIEHRVYEDTKNKERLREEMYSMPINQTYVDALFTKNA